MIRGVPIKVNLFSFGDRSALDKWEGAGGDRRPNAGNQWGLAVFYKNMYSH